MSTMPADTESPEAAPVVEEGVPAEIKEPRQRNLSKTSKQYDVDGDGELDSVELAMREMDQEGLGHLSNAKVYKIMREQLEANKRVFNLKRIVMILVGLVVLLAVSNLGTAWAAFKIAKDTEVDKNGEMYVKGTDMNVAVVNAQRFVELEPDTNSRRMVAADCNGDGKVDAGCYSVTDMQTGKILQADVNGIYSSILKNSDVKIKVANPCDASKTDVHSAYDNTMSYTVTTKMQGNAVTVVYLKTTNKLNPKPYFTFECAASTKQNPVCDFTYDTGVTVQCGTVPSISKCSDIGANPMDACKTAGQQCLFQPSTTCPVLNSAGTGCTDSITLPDSYCDCLNGVWACIAAGCPACTECSNLGNFTAGDYCYTGNQKCNDPNGVQCNCTSSQWVC